MPPVYHSDTPGHGARLFPLSSALALGYFSARLLQLSAAHELGLSSAAFPRQSVPGARPLSHSGTHSALPSHSNTRPVHGVRVSAATVDRALGLSTAPPLQCSTTPLVGHSSAWPLQRSDTHTLCRSVAMSLMLGRFTGLLRHSATWFSDPSSLHLSSAWPPSDSCTRPLVLLPCPVFRWRGYQSFSCSSTMTLRLSSLLSFGGRLLLHSTPPGL